MIDLKITEDEYKKLLKQQEFAEQAKFAKDFIDRFCDNIVDTCKEKFEEYSTNNYSRVDESRIFMVQLQIAMAKQLKQAISSAMFQGKLADEKLLGGSNNVGRIE